jgi:hypothetical protein
MVVTLDSRRRLTVPVGVTRTRPGELFEVDYDAEEDAPFKEIG